MAESKESNWIWWVVGVVAVGGIGWVFYLFMAAPLPKKYQKDYTAEAKVQLSRACRMLGDYHSRTGRYTKALDSIGYYQAESDGGMYWVEIEQADSSGMRLRAYARVDWDEDGYQSVWEAGGDCVPRELQGD